MRASQKSKRQEAVDSVNAHAVISLVQYMTGLHVSQTGIYEIIHHGQHFGSYEVVLISGNCFPHCEVCGEEVRFRLLATSPYIFHDEDFAPEDIDCEMPRCC